MTDETLAPVPESDGDTYLECPECAAPCFPSVSGLWVAGIIKLCTGCGARLMVGMSVEVQNLDEIPKLRRRVARAWQLAAEVIVRAEDVEVSVEPFEGSESQGFVASAKVCGVKLSESAEDRGAAMTKLVDAARVRGQMECER